MTQHTTVRINLKLLCLVISIFSLSAMLYYVIMCVEGRYKSKTVLIQLKLLRCERAGCSLCLIAAGNVLSKFPYFYSTMYIKAQPPFCTILSISHSFGGCNHHSCTSLPF
jgi:hypothetical protein